MYVEWLLIALLVCGAGFLCCWRGATFLVRLAGGILAVIVLLAAGWWERRLEGKRDSRARLNAPHVGRPEEFAGSETCRACHPDQYASWHRSFHRTMTQIASPQTVRGSFDNVALELDGETYRLERRGDEFWADMVDPDWTIQQALKGPTNRFTAGESEPPRAQCRITLLTGSHHMQAYWVDNQHGNRQYNFPFIYLFEEERWVPRRSVFLRDPDVKRWIQVWNVGCINCHSTAGQPRQGKDGMSFDTRVAELGIACESCHGPAVDHVRLNSDPLRRYDLHFAGRGDQSIVNPARLSSKRSADVCGRCHSIHGPRYEKDWEENGESFRPGENLEEKMRIYRTFTSPEARRGSFWSDGMVRVSGREYNGLIRTPCFQRGEMSCLSCHSMHQSDPDDQLAKGMESNTACFQCHDSFKQNLTQHTRHQAESAGSLCYNCHMPHTTYGLLKALRSHEISNPSVTETLQTGRPNACNLCHLDKTLEWTALTLTRWYQTPPVELSTEEKTVAASVLWTLKGDAGQRALTAWHLGWKPAREISKDAWMPPYLAMLLDDPYPAVRYIAARSLKRLAGYEDFPYDYVAAPDGLQRSREQAMELWIKMTKPIPEAPLLFESAGQLNRSAVENLLKARDHRVVELNE